MRVSTMVLMCLIGAASPLAAQPPEFARFQYAASMGTRGIVAADMDRDGRLDLITANSDPDTVELLHNDSGTGGGFRAIQTMPLKGGPFGIVAADLNHDGIPDVVIANADDNSITILNGSSGGNLRLPLYIGANGYPRDVAVADVNGDGWLDLIYSAFYDNNIAVVLANGFGGFSSFEITTAVGERPQGLATGDFNHDGHADVVVANTGANTLMLMLGDGTGHFTRVDVPGPKSLNEVVAADLDGDGWLDVAAVSTTSNIIDVYRGSSTGLSLTYSGGTGASPRGVAAGDLNGDGRLDLVTANRDSDSVTVLIARVGPSLAFDRTDLPADDGGRAVEIADLNGDGHLDFAVGNQFAGAISVFINQSSPGPGPAEIVLYAHRGTPHGTWRATSDSSAAETINMWDPNAGAPKVTTALANPPNYFELQFVADPNLSYKLWIRLRAQDNYWANDSVWVQFTGAKTESGDPVYEIGTASGLAVNLEECNGCGVSKWGWRDDAWGSAGAISNTVLRFPAGGTRTIRIQTREDGVMIDQIVLSSSVYRSTRPGATRDDTTILPRVQ